MKVFIIAVASMDGFIAKDSAHPSFNWNSKDDKKRFRELTKLAGVVVVGSSTYKTFASPLKERLNIVYTRSDSFKGIEGVETTQDEPAVLLQKLEARGFKEVAICGGSHIYTMFLKAKVVDHIYLTVEPLIFGAGVKLFNEELSVQLTLVSAVQGENGALLIEYKVNNSGSL